MQPQLHHDNYLACTAHTIQQQGSCIGLILPKFPWFVVQCVKCSGTDCMHQCPAAAWSSHRCHRTEQQAAQPDCGQNSDIYEFKRGRKIKTARQKQNAPRPRYPDTALGADPQHRDLVILPNTAMAAKSTRTASTRVAAQWMHCASGCCLYSAIKVHNPKPCWLKPSNMRQQQPSWCLSLCHTVWTGSTWVLVTYRIQHPCAAQKTAPCASQLFHLIMR